MYTTMSESNTHSCYVARLPFNLSFFCRPIVEPWQGMFSVQPVQCGDYVVSPPQVRLGLRQCQLGTVKRKVDVTHLSESHGAEYHQPHPRCRP